MEFLNTPTRHVFFTGKGGVGKTSLACATAIALADRGRKVLLISTDPASNLDEVLETPLGQAPTSIASAPGLSAMNLDPEVAARTYRERVVGPYRGVLPDAAVASIEEQLSGACTVEIAAFEEFAKLLGDEKVTAEFDHILFDTAPSGHTLRLLELPAAWTQFIATNTGGTSCLGPLSGLKAQRATYEAAKNKLANRDLTTVILVSRAETSALLEAARTSSELGALGVTNQHLVINGIFKATVKGDVVADALDSRGTAAIAAMPAALAKLSRSDVALVSTPLLGVESLRLLLNRGSAAARTVTVSDLASVPNTQSLSTLISGLERSGRGVIMTMGKGGVGKTTIAAAIAVELAKRGHAVTLSTTDPAAHVANAVGGSVPGLTIARIDPARETRDYVAEVLATAGAGLDASGRALLEEDLSSPCTEEIAVFRAFARTVDEGKDGFVVLDTAPTGHTLLLLDAAETYHREVSRSLTELPQAVTQLLPRLRDPAFTKIILVTLPEATPVHEAARLERDLERAGITPYAWVINQSFLASGTSDPILVERGAQERRYIDEVMKLAKRTILLPWRVERPEGLAELHRFVMQKSGNTAEAAI